MNITEKYALILLFFACLFMAGLNLWLIFKEWFNKNYAKKCPEKDTTNYIGKSKTQENLIIGESKFNLEQERQKRNEVETIKANDPILSIPLEEVSEHPLNNQPISSEEGISLDTIYTREDAELANSQGVTIDQFKMLAQSLSNNAISKEEALQVADIIPKVRGTDMSQQYMGQVKGTEQKVLEIISMAESENEDIIAKSNFDFTRYLRT